MIFTHFAYKFTELCFCGCYFFFVIYCHYSLFYVFAYNAFFVMLKCVMARPFLYVCESRCPVDSTSEVKKSES